jgi:glycosyltransferase involved in cell wall biosynthesis
LANAQPRVSIGLTVYNGGELFEETLKSFLAQSFADFELIICDNASTDGTRDTALRYVQLDSRLRYHRNEINVGLGPNHNIAFRLANGTYFKWASGDDLLLPRYLERCVEMLDANPDVVLAYPRTRFIDTNGAPLEIEDPGWDLRSAVAPERLRFVIYSGHWCNAFVGLIRRDALAKTRLMPSYPGGDFRVLGELSVLGKFAEVPEYLFQRRLHPRSSSQHTQDLSWQVEYWTGSGRHIRLPFWSLGFDHARTIVSSPFSLPQKLSLAGSLLRAMYWGRPRLTGELKAGARLLCTRMAEHLDWFRPRLARTEGASDRAGGHRRRQGDPTSRL